MQSRIPIALLACAISTGLLAQPPVTDAILAKAASDGANWITYGGDPEETRHSAADQITPENAGELGLVWSYEVGEGGGNQEATPLVWNGTMYSITNWSIVFALDAATGKEKWRFDPEVNQTTVRPRICCGVVQRGVALYEGLVIAPVIDGRLIALDAETGQPVWESRVSWAQDNYTLTMAPRMAGGRVIIGAAGGELGTRGFFSAFDAKTGDFLWKFYTVPGDPSKPYENEWMKRAAQTWPKDFRLLDRGRWGLGVGRHFLRSRVGYCLRRYGQWRSVASGAARFRGADEFVYVLDCGGARSHRRTGLVFPDGAGRFLGSRRGATDGAGGSGDRRTAAARS